MKIVNFIYEGNEVDFEPTGDANVMVNATQMAKIFGKRIDVFIKSDHAKAFIEVLEFTPFGGNSDPLKRDEIIQTKGQSGTWMHRILALKFAAWLSPAFELWVYSTIDSILFGYYKDHRDATIEKLKAQEAIDQKKRELLSKYPDFQEFIDLENKLSEADKKRTKALKASLSQLKLGF
ncbi:KilA-N domain-containing protein [Ekhidna sp.]|jgi:hypothetical protein|uniref:KilA-N domain-containing protein n=1 Tax=Ekhidna sp. TaxID=2608089 RepID=UPI0032EAEA70